MVGSYRTKVDYWLNPSRNFQRVIKVLARNSFIRTDHAAPSEHHDAACGRGLAIARTASMSSGRVAQEQTNRKAPPGQG